jgi:hypothetical protein
VNREVLATFEASLGDPDAILQDNGCYNRLDWSGGRWAVVGVNVLSRAQGAGRPDATKVASIKAVVVDSAPKKRAVDRSPVRQRHRWIC